MSEKGMYCVKCGVRLPPDFKEPLCAYCRSQIAIEEMSKDPIWALHKILENLATEMDNLKIRILELEKMFIKT